MPAFGRENRHTQTTCQRCRGIRGQLVSVGTERSWILDPVWRRCINYRRLFFIAIWTRAVWAGGVVRGTYIVPPKETTRRASAVPKPENVRYTEYDWSKEDADLKRGKHPQPCPRCTRRGFYAARLAPPNRKYRACKFCGFWQDVGKAPHPIIRYECSGSDGHWVADWKEPHESWTCPTCGRRYTPEQAVAWPAEEPTHWWNQAPKAGTQADFIAFWRDKGISPPRFGIP